ncbi:MAG: D-alanine--D-alanine ligase [Aureibaculum sp.]|nr:D-alanine--D-alanine ligase [Aureibaculum sp.]
MIRIKSFFTKLLQWEHWPTFMFYAPLIPYYIISAIKAKHPVFFLTINPAIKYSGHGTESKYETIQMIPQRYRPLSILIHSGSTINDVLLKIKEKNIHFPLIAKPDIGFRGYLVKKIDSKDELELYLKKNKLDIIIQEFIDYKKECGILYYRLPGEKQGKITSITLKKFLTVTGNGKSNLSELIITDKRAYLYYSLLKNIHKEKMFNIPKDGELIKLTVIGNHSKGTQFLNGNHLISVDLEQTFDVINDHIDGWNYGRLDIKYNSFEELTTGVNFKILEINGIISEPTHIYDPTNASYFDAIKNIKKHWEIMNVIALKNHSVFKIPYPKIKPYIKDLLWLRKHSKTLINLNKLN